MSFKYNRTMKFFTIVALCFLTFACRSEYDLAMERGIHLYEMNDFSAAISEFKYVIAELTHLQDNTENQRLLSEAHKKLALVYAKKAEGSDEAQDAWYEKSLEEINKSIDILPDEKKMTILERIKAKVKS